MEKKWIFIVIGLLSISSVLRASSVEHSQKNHHISMFNDVRSPNTSLDTELNQLPDLYGAKVSDISVATLNTNAYQYLVDYVNNIRETASVDESLTAYAPYMDYYGEMTKIETIQYEKFPVLIDLNIVKNSPYQSDERLLYFQTLHIIEKDGKTQHRLSFHYTRHLPTSKHFHAGASVIVTIDDRTLTITTALDGKHYRVTPSNANSNYYFIQSALEKKAGTDNPLTVPSISKKKS